MRLTAAQQRALDHVRNRARAAAPRAGERIAAVLAGAAPSPPAPALVDGLRRRAAVTLNFHPDRIAADGRTVAESMLADGRYRNQFESRISAGSRTAFPGGERDRWEEQLFGGAYHRPPAAAPERPKYGGLNLMEHPDGASPRFGSCHVRLRRDVADRSTLCFGDSHTGPADIGTLDTPEAVLAALLEDVAATGRAVGRPGLDVGAVVGLLLQDPPAPLPPLGPGRALDDYIEAQVHGEVDLGDDVEAIVVDPSFRSTDTGVVLAAVGARYDIPVLRHRGFVLEAGEVPDDFRGPAMVPLAARVLREFAPAGALLTAAVLGRAARSLHLEPHRWADWGTADETFQHIKQLWHVLVRYGHPQESGGGEIAVM